jgi:hypothetical protein
MLREIDGAVVGGRAGLLLDAEALLGEDVGVVRGDGVDRVGGERHDLRVTLAVGHARGRRMVALGIRGQIAVFHQRGAAIESLFEGANVGEREGTIVRRFSGSGTAITERSTPLS